MSSKMWQWTLLYTLLCLATPLLAHGEVANFTRVIETTLANPATVRMNSHLFTVSKTKKLLTVNSTDPAQKVCKLAVNPFDENIQGRVRVAAIEISKKLLVWGIRSTEIDGTLRRTYYTMLFVDPYDCGYKPLRLDEDQVPLDWPTLAPTVVLYPTGYDAHFDVYFPTQQKCNPCIYDARSSGGKWVYDVLSSHGGAPRREFSMQWYGDWNNWDYYFYVYNFDNGTAALKLVTRGSLSVAKKTLVDHTIDAFAVNYGTYQNSAVCYATPSNPGPSDHQNVTCERLNERLRPALTWQLPQSKDRLVHGIAMEVDRVGNTLIGVMYSGEIHLYAYNVDGDFVDDLEFGRVDDALGYKELRGMRVDSEYCLTTVEQTSAEAAEGRHVVKCVDVSKYLE